MEAQKKPLTKEQEFEKAAMPLMEYLALNHHPHMSVIVTSTNAELLEGQMTAARMEEYL